LALIHADKWIHIGLFGMLCFLFNFPLGKSAFPNNTKTRWFLVISISGILYGTVMEFAQKTWITNRSFELMDILADSIGCIIAFGLSRKMLMERG
jgi:VanZ family protein